MRSQSHNARIPQGTAAPLQRPRLPFPAPFDAFSSFRHAVPDELTLLKACRAAAVWRSRRGIEALREWLRLTGWLLRFPGQVAGQLHAHGRAAHAAFGRSLAGQFGDLLAVGLRNGVLPRDYYAGGLARCGGDARLFRLVPFALYETVAAAVLRTSDRGGLAAAADKLAFEETCRRAGIAVVETVATLPPAEGDGTGQFAPGRYLLKPRTGGQGKGILALALAEDADDRMRGDFRHAAEAHAERVGRQILVQRRLANHRDLAAMSGPALATTRIVTIWNEAGEPEVVEAFYRTSTTHEAAVDNFHAGGTFFTVDVASGDLQPGFGQDFAMHPATLVTHPLTGAAMAGRQLPGWPAMRALALRLAQAFPDLPIVGWDVGYAADGAVAVEANAPPGITPTRQFATGGLVGTRFLALLAWHAGRWLLDHEPDGSRWRPAALAATVTQRGALASRSGLLEDG